MSPLSDDARGAKFAPYLVSDPRDVKVSLAACAGGAADKYRVVGRSGLA